MRIWFGIDVSHGNSSTWTRHAQINDFRPQKGTKERVQALPYLWLCRGICLTLFFDREADLVNEANAVEIKRRKRLEKVSTMIGTRGTRRIEWSRMPDWRTPSLVAHRTSAISVWRSTAASAVEGSRVSFQSDYRWQYTYLEATTELTIYLSVSWKYIQIVPFATITIFPPSGITILLLSSVTDLVYNVYTFNMELSLFQCDSLLVDDTPPETYDRVAIWTCFSLVILFSRRKHVFDMLWLFIILSPWYHVCMSICLEFGRFTFWSTIVLWVLRTRGLRFTGLFTSDFPQNIHDCFSLLSRTFARECCSWWGCCCCCCCCSCWDICS